MDGTPNEKRIKNKKYYAVYIINNEKNEIVGAISGYGCDVQYGVLPEYSTKGYEG